jgi:glycosyltransferase involved in cell wall biosynthesis
MNENKSNQYKISVITATYNAMEHLPNLIECLRNQEDRDFEWVVADGASTDGTLELLQSITDLNIVITSQEDFGIYDALNRGIKVSNGEFYLVMGADDLLYPNGVNDYKDAIEDGVDIITAQIKYKEKIAQPSKKPDWWSGMAHYISGHAVGTIFRKKIHDTLGFYSKNFPICADQYFVISAIKNNFKLSCIENLVGEFNDAGLSGQDKLGTLTELYRIKLSKYPNHNFLITCQFLSSLARLRFSKSQMD